jgi:mono/diheme cytochrome c family protein
MFRNLFPKISPSRPPCERDSYQGTPSGVPKVPNHETAFRRWKSAVAASPRPASLRNVLTTTIALLALAAISAQAQNSAAATADLPAGPMQAKATAACLECHEARIILQQRLSKGAWTKEVDKMVKWGAQVDPADRDALIDYLSTNFSPDKPSYNPQRTAGSGKTAK